MLSQLSVLAVLLACVVPAAAARLAALPESLIGTWACGPTTMNGPKLVMEVTSITKFATDRTFKTTTTNVIKPSNRSPVTVVISSHGTWRLEGATLIWLYQESKFLSSSDPIISVEMGQKVEDDELRKKSLYKSKIVEISQELMRRIPLDSAYAEAVVESKCRRTAI